MDLVPEKVDGGVVFNVVKSCGGNVDICGNCGDFAVAIHNWLMASEVRYVVVDLQDEKVICPQFLEEILQLKRRMKVPFKFAGVMEKPQQLLKNYNYLLDNETYATPADAFKKLEQEKPGPISQDSSQGFTYWCLHCDKSTQT